MFAFGSPPKGPPLPPSPICGIQFAAAIAGKHEFDLLLERFQVGDVIRADAAATENADVRERVEVGQCDLLRLHSAHGKSSHRAMRLIRHRAIVGVNVGNQVVDEHIARNALKLKPPRSGAGRYLCTAAALFVASRRKTPASPGPPILPPFSMTMMKGLALPSAIRLSMIKLAWP